MPLKTALRDRVYDAVAAAAGAFPFAAAADAFYRGRAPIVFYHAVWKRGDPRLALFGGVEEGAFVSDMTRLARRFEFAPLGDILCLAPARSGRPKVAITFDDGFDLIAGGAADILDRLRIPATVFVNSDSWRYERVLWQHAFGVVRAIRGEAEFIAAFNRAQRRRGLGSDIGRFSEFIDATKSWPQSEIDPVTDEVWSAAGLPDMRAFLEERRPYFDREGLSEWRRRGHDVGFHGKSHQWSRALDERGIEAQYIAPARDLKAEFGLGAVAFAYPFGDRLPPRHEAMLRESGLYSCLLGTDRLARRGESPFAVDRIEADFGLARHFFGRPIVQALRGRDRAAVY